MSLHRRHLEHGAIHHHHVNTHHQLNSHQDHQLHELLLLLDDALVLAHVAAAHADTPGASPLPRALALHCVWLALVALPPLSHGSGELSIHSGPPAAGEGAGGAGRLTAWEREQLLGAALCNAACDDLLSTRWVYGGGLSLFSGGLNAC